MKTILDISNAIQHIVDGIKDHPCMEDYDMSEVEEVNRFDRDYCPPYEQYGTFSCTDAVKNVNALLQYGQDLYGNKTFSIEFSKKTRGVEQPVWGLELIHKAEHSYRDKPNLVYMYVYSGEQKVYMDPDDIEEQFASLKGPELLSELQIQEQAFTESRYPNAIAKAEEAKKQKALANAHRLMGSKMSM